METVKAIDGCFLHFTDKEWTAIAEMLDCEGYTCDSSGLKKFIIDFTECRNEEPPPGLGDNLKEFMGQNPDAIEYYAHAAKGIFNILKNKMRR